MLIIKKASDIVKGDILYINGHKFPVINVWIRKRNKIFQFFSKFGICSDIECCLYLKHIVNTVYSVPIDTNLIVVENKHGFRTN